MRFAVDFCSRLLPLAILAITGCKIQEIDTQTAVVDTRGVPIVQVVIEGPGGDLVPVDHYEVVDRVLVVTHPRLLASVILSVLVMATTLYLIRRSSRE